LKEKIHIEPSEEQVWLGPAIIWHRYFVRGKKLKIVFYVKSLLGELNPIFFYFSLIRTKTFVF